MPRSQVCVNAVNMPLHSRDLPNDPTSIAHHSVGVPRASGWAAAFAFGFRVSPDSNVTWD